MFIFILPTIVASCTYPTSAAAPLCLVIMPHGVNYGRMSVTLFRDQAFMFMLVFISPVVL